MAILNSLNIGVIRRAPNSKQLKSTINKAYPAVNASCDFSARLAFPANNPL